MALTPATLRLDTTGRACGQGHIAANKKCSKSTSVSTRTAVAAGLGVAAIAGGVYGLSRRKPTPARISLSAPAVVQPGAPIPALPGDRTTRQLRGSTPYGLLPPAPPRQSKTARMRANTRASMQVAERQIAQTAREEVRRIGQIGNTMAAAGEATGNLTKTTLRELRLRTEAARRRFEPGYRKQPVQREPAQLPPSTATTFKIPLPTPEPLTPESVMRDPRTGQPRRRRPQGFGQ